MRFHGAKGSYGERPKQTKRSQKEKTGKVSFMIELLSIKEITATLQKYADDPAMHSDATYSPNANDYPDNKLPFVEYHLHYLRTHKLVNPDHYLSNLRLKITKR